MFKDIQRQSLRYRAEVTKQLSKEHISSVKKELEREAKGKRLVVFHLMSKKRWGI